MNFQVLHLRDQAIHVSHDEIAMFRSIASEKNEQIKEMHDFIERQKEDNREIELNNQESEKNLFKLKQEYKNLEQINLDIAAEVDFHLFILINLLLSIKLSL